MEEFDVLVVGGGAAGLAATAALARYGITTLLVEERPEPPTLPRATVISTRSMELLRSWGLEQQVLAGGVDADVWLWECVTLASATTGTAHAVGYPSRAQAAVVSPTAPGTVPQDWLEHVLRGHVGRQPSIRFELGTVLVDLDNALDGTRATVRDAAGASRTVRARYVVAADGAHSTIRKILAIPMREHEGSLGGVQVVFRADLWQILGDLRYGLYVVTTPEAPGLFLPAGRDRWVYAPTLASEDPLPDLAPARLEALIRMGAGTTGVEPRIERVGAFHSNAELAERFRVGRTFLTGDAAHRVTPRGGTGMNTALQSGYDIGWKLAWVLQGWAEPALLDTYEAERRAVAEHNVVRSSDPNGSRRPVIDELNVDLGGRVAHAWLPSSGGQVSTVDLVAAGWTLFTGPSSDAWDTASASCRAPITVRHLDPMTARTVGVRGDGALLARPDGVPVAVWPSSAGAAELRRATELSGVPAGRDLAVA